MAGLGTVTDYVCVKDLRVQAVIGVHDWEREIEQTLIFTVDMAADVRKPAATDNLADALDYSAVAAAITAVVREGKFRLIETAAERVAERLLASFPVTWLRLELRKPIGTAPTPSAATPTPSVPVSPTPSAATPTPSAATPTPSLPVSPTYTAAITIERRSS
jgi:dihydroneopterin aldolase